MALVGFRNTWYNPKRRELHIWGWDETGARIEQVTTFNPYLFVETTTKPDAYSIYKTPLKKITFPSSFDRNKFIHDSGNKRLFYNIKPEQQGLIDEFLYKQANPEFLSGKLRIFYLDIEVYSPHVFPVATKAAHPINLISVHDSLSDTTHTFGLKSAFSPTKPNSIYYRCSTESDLLERFLIYWKSNYPDVVVGWNSEQFDIPYVINRINQILGDTRANDLSPVKSVYYRDGIRSQFGQTLGRWHIHGLSCIDYMEAYKSFSRAKRESYSLNYIAQVELNEGKIAFNATNLAQLSVSDWQTFVEYNIQDVHLLCKLEQKLRFLQIVQMISYKGFCSMEQSMGKIAVITGAIAHKALVKGYILPTFEKENMGNYAGGFVKEIESGLYEDIITFDANSLYPNTLITLNLSPETKIGKITHTHESGDVDVTLVTGKTYTLDPTSLDQFLKVKSIAISSANVLYSQTDKGIIPEYVDALYAERVVNKNRMMELERQNSVITKNSDEYEQNKVQIEQLDIIQYTLKILLNSIYGVFANKNSAFYDIDHAASITLTGQTVIKESSAIADAYIKTKYNAVGNSYIYSDTDSSHLSMKPLLTAIGETLLDSDGKIKSIAYEKANELQEVINKGITEWSARVLHSTDPRFFFKREAICPVAIYQSKKHYILHVKDKGESVPVPCDYIKYVGVEVVKSTMSSEVKKLIKSVVESIVYTKSKKGTDAVYRKAYETFKALPIEAIAFRSKITDYEKYAKNAKGMYIGKGQRTPPTHRSAIYHNELLKVYNVESKYDAIGSGQKIKWVYVQPNNKYGIACIGFINELPIEFLADIKPDYEKMFDTIVQPVIDRFYECLHWPYLRINEEYAVNLLELFSE